MKVKAAIATSRGEALRLGGLTLSEPRSDEILVKMIACGVAQADLDAIDGRLAMPLPFVPGSEGAGIVERVGAEVTSLKSGDAVIIGFDHCGQCAACTAGRPRACLAFAAYNLAGRRTDGTPLFEEGGISGRFFGQSSFATHVACRATCATRLAKGSPLEVLACLGGDVLIGAGTVMRAFDPKVDESLLVSGAGAVGLAATMMARASGVQTIVVVEQEERRRDLASELGATVVVHPDENLPDLVRSVTADGARFVLETTGARDARDACLASLAEGGTCAYVGRAGDETSSSGILYAEDYACPSTLIPKLAALHARGDFPLEQLVDFFAFEHVNDALDAVRSGAAAKPVLRFSIGGFGDLDRARIEGAQADPPSPTSEPAPPSREKTTVKS